MERGAASGALLYVSDVGTDSVYVYTYPNIRLVGTLTGFSQPLGECTDKQANVWIVDFGNQTTRVVEFAHGGTTPINTLSESAPGVGCSVNPRNGDLAVSNLSTGSSNGSIAIYKAATGSPIIYPADPVFVNVFFLAYDSHGNLFLDGQNRQGFQFGSFKKKSGFTPIAINGVTFNCTGGVFTKGLNLSVGDQCGSYGHAVIYQISDSGSVLGTTNLGGDGTCVQYFIYGTQGRQKVVCPSADYPDVVNVYSYPAGGTPMKVLKKFSRPYGSAISP